MDAFSWFVAGLRLTMRARYQASNSMLAIALTDFAMDRGFHSEPQFSGDILRRWGDPRNATKIQSYQLRTMYTFFLDRQLIPETHLGWTGLILVHQHLQGDNGQSLPKYLHDHGATTWISMVANTSKEQNHG